MCNSPTIRGTNACSPYDVNIKIFKDPYGLPGAHLAELCRAKDLQICRVTARNNKFTFF